MNEKLVIELFIKPFLSFLRSTIKNAEKRVAFDRYFIEARNLLLQWYPVEDFPATFARSKSVAPKRKKR